MFALDSLELRPSLGTLGDERKATVDFEESAPGLLVGHSTFSPGGLTVGRIILVVGLTNKSFQLCLKQLLKPVKF